MSTVEWVAAVQHSGPEFQTSNPPAAGYFAVGLVAVVLGLVVWIFIRTSTRRSSKH